MPSSPPRAAPDPTTGSTRTGTGNSNGSWSRPEPIPSGDWIEWNYTTRAYEARDFEAPVRPAFFTGGHADAAVDVDSDGLADFLELTADVHVNAAGNYTLSGYLSGPSGSDVVRTIAYASRDFDLSTGDANVFLRFRGDQIRQAGVDGPWNSTVTLFGLEPPVLGTFPPESGALRPIPFYYPETLCGTTGVYRATAFDDMVEFLRYTGRFEETTPDRDADGKFDALVVRAEVEVFVGAGFDLSGILRPVGGSAQVARATGPIWLRDGTQWVDFTFLGPEIRTSGMDGPYEATMSLTPGTWGIDPTTTYLTKAYHAADFDDESIGTRGYWIAKLSATSQGSSLSIAGEVERGNDVLAVVFEDTLTVTLADSAGSAVRTFQTKVVLASSGSSQSFSFSADGLSSGTYTVTAVLGPADRPVEVIQGDALRVDWPRFDVMTSNLPYQISSPLTFRLLDHAFDRAVLMYQWEFARRMRASPGTADYSRLTVGVYRRAACEILERVPRNAFYPQPRVDSAIVSLVPRPSPFPLEELGRFDAVVDALFAHRRKTVENGLRLGWAAFARSREELEALLPGVPHRTRRVGELSPEEIARIAEAIRMAKG